MNIGTAISTKLPKRLFRICSAASPMSRPGRAEVSDAARDHREADRAAQQGDADEYPEHQREGRAHALSDASDARRRAIDDAAQRRTTMTAAARKTL